MKQQKNRILSKRRNNNRTRNNPRVMLKIVNKIQKNSQIRKRFKRIIFYVNQKAPAKEKKKQNKVPAAVEKAKSKNNKKAPQGGAK